MVKVYYGFDYDLGIYKLIVRPTTKEDIDTVFGKDSLFSNQSLDGSYTAELNGKIFAMNHYDELMEDLHSTLGALMDGE